MTHIITYPVISGNAEQLTLSKTLISPRLDERGNKRAGQYLSP